MKTTEYYHFLKLIQNDYSDILNIKVIGYTYNGQPIQSISFKNEESKSAMLFTGIHHAREPVTLLMNLYIILRIIYELETDNSFFKELIYTRNVHFIPLINVDGYEENVNLFNPNDNNGQKFGLVRKNRRVDKIFSQCIK